MLTAFATLLVQYSHITFNPFTTGFLHPRVNLTLSLLGSPTHVLRFSL